jgi:hypothetical protein
MKRLLKWFGIAMLIFAVLVVIFLLSLDSILRSAAEKTIYERTGMQAEIGEFHLGLLSPVVTIKDLKLHNPPAFGGTPFLNVPEIHVEYDRDALLNNQLHLTLARINLGELDIVKNEAGKTNLLAFGIRLPSKDKAANEQAMADFKRSTGMAFKGIDVLNVSVGTAKFIDLTNPANNREQKIAIENQVVKNIQSPADLAGLAVLIVLRGGDFFPAVLGPMVNIK